MPIYCGNNRLHPDVTSGAKTIGSRYSCLRLGFGRAMNEPVNFSYAGPYRSIDNRKFYCGNKNQLPVGYSDFGTLSQCLQKGYGAGKKKKASEARTPPRRRQRSRSPRRGRPQRRRSRSRSTNRGRHRSNQRRRRS